MIVMSLNLASTNYNKFKEHKIIEIEQIEDEIFHVLISGSVLIYFLQKSSFFHASSCVATYSLRCVKFINSRQETIILGGINTAYPEKPFFLGPQKKNVFLNRLQCKICHTLQSSGRKKNRDISFIFS